MRRWAWSNHFKSYSIFKLAVFRFFKYLIDKLIIKKSSDNWFFESLVDSEKKSALKKPPAASGAQTEKLMRQKLEIF